jgi:hypothetical protein
MSSTVTVYRLTELRNLESVESFAGRDIELKRGH